MRNVYIVILLCLITGSLSGVPNDIEISPSRGDFIQSKPNSVLTLAFVITNNTHLKQSLSSTLELPAGWRQITSDETFEIEPHQTELRIVGFSVPKAALARIYELSYRIDGIEGAALFESRKIQVEILPLRELTATLVDEPSFVIAGENYQATFVILNAGNIDITVATELTSIDLVAALDISEFELSPGENRTITATVRTNKKVKKSFQHLLQLKISVVDHPEVTALVTSTVEVIRRKAFIPERFHKLPITTTFRHVHQQIESSRSGFQGEVYGSGSLDVEKTKKLQFLFRGPDVFEKSIFGEHDEYFFRYRTNHYNVHIGDRAYSLTAADGQLSLWTWWRRQPQLTSFSNRRISHEDSLLLAGSNANGLFSLF